jgi:DnaJ-class molecular chaperone
MSIVASDSATRRAPGESSRGGSPRPAPSGHPGGSRIRLFEPRGVTLEDAVQGAWEELAAGRRAECPVCGGSMSMLEGCESCGSELS